MKSFSQLVGSTTSGQYPASFVELSQNLTTNNVSLGGILVNNQHRYYLQKYFDNERTYTTVTIGAQTLTLTGTLAVGATTATLNTAWTSITCQQLVVFSKSDQRTVTFTQGSTNIFWQTGLTAVTTTSISALGVQAYPIPANVSKIKNDSITVGQLVYQPAPVQSIQEWTQLNSIPYTSDIAAYFFIYQNQVNFWPIPSTSGNIITFNYKARVADMTYTDYSNATTPIGTIAITPGSNIITGTSTLWTAFPQNVDLSYANLMICPLPPGGDGLWYPIQQFTSATSVTLNLPIVNAPLTTGVNYVIGQFPLLQEDFHDILIYSSLAIYFSTIVQDESKFKMYDALTKEREDLMKQYLGTKSVNVDLGAQPISSNPNLYIYAH